MNRFLLPLLCLLLFNCKKKDSCESIIFTTGYFMNPAQPRFGIEIKKDTVFYCEEIITDRGNYNYYYCIYDKKTIKNLQNEIRSTFGSRIETSQVPDATLCRLDIINVNDTLKTKFYLETLKSNQYDLLGKLISLKNCKLKKIKYHSFPKELLESKLPQPPSVGSEEN